MFSILLFLSAIQFRNQRCIIMQTCRSCPVHWCLFHGCYGRLWDVKRRNDKNLHNWFYKMQKECLQLMQLLQNLQILVIFSALPFISCHVRDSNLGISNCQEVYRIFHKFWSNWRGKNSKLNFRNWNSNMECRKNSHF